MTDRRLAGTGLDKLNDALDEMRLQSMNAYNMVYIDDAADR